MNIIVDAETNVVIAQGEKVHTWDNGYPVLTNENIAFVKENVFVYEVRDLPSENCIRKYCYTPDKGFYINPDWKEPEEGNIWNVPDEVYRQIKDSAIQEVQNELNK